MKIRDGFVSNSSSSSFLIGIAKILDMDKTKEIIKADSCGYWDTFEIKEVAYYSDKIEESFMYDKVQCDCEIGDHVLVLYNLNDEGDSHFDPNCTGDMDYDVDYNDCTSPDVEKTLKKLDEAGCIGNMDMAYGAGRNG